MKASYSQELAALARAYEDALSAPSHGLEGFRTQLGRGPAAFVGSGGALVVAHLAAALHEQHFHQPAQVCTALEAIGLSYQPDRGALLVSASAKHPDSELVLEAFRRRLFGKCGVLTHRSGADLAEKAGWDTAVLQLPTLPVRDGFLATGSVMQMVVALLRSSSIELSEKLEINLAGEAGAQEEVLVLTSPRLRSVAADIEVRLVESGLAAVQVSDYRNFAHGRHTGFERRINRTTVLGLSDRDSYDLALGTLRCLPAAADVRHWHQEEAWPASVPPLLARSMVFAGAVGEEHGLDIARPTVPKFGRQLYRLPLKRRVPLAVSDGIERKLRAAHESDRSLTSEKCAEAFSGWSEQLHEQRFSAIVMDYDGTVCWTSRRFDLPEAGIRERLLAVLAGGTTVGFASGRGRSLHADLRQWIPRDLWDTVLLGLYNGAAVLKLSEDLEDLRAGSPWSSAVVEALADQQVATSRITERGQQVSVEVAVSRMPQASLMAEILENAGLQATVVTSGHSVDIVPRSISKTVVLERLEFETGGAVLAIGDQGQRRGNDFELLGSRPWTLTVDLCSSDLSRCWFLGNGKAVGPDLLDRYLGSLRELRGGLAVRWTAPV